MSVVPQEALAAALATVDDPEIRKPITELGMVESCTCDEAGRVAVTILLTVDPDGRVRDCRVTQPSPDAEADAITCRLASERFRFRPARNAAGEAVTGKYAWRQRWFY